MRNAAGAVVISLLMTACQSGPDSATTTAALTTPPAASAPSSTASQPTTTTEPPTTAAPWVQPPHRIVIEDGAFLDRETGLAFVPRGVNYLIFPSRLDGERTFSPPFFRAEQVRADFGALVERGYNTVRVFLDLCSSGAGCITSRAGGLDGAYLDTIVEVMHIARETGLFLLATSNDLPDEGRYWTISERGNGPSFPGYRNTNYLTAPGHEATATYWDDLLGGLVERQAPFDIILGWSILNEQWLFGDQPPLSLDEGVVTTATGDYDMAVATEKRAMVVDNLRAYIAQTAAVIRRQDPTALVTMGFFVPQFPNPSGVGGTRYVDTAPLVEDSDLDFFDFHAYPGWDIGFPQIGENYGITDDKPVVMGEVGGFVHDFRSAEQAGVAVQQWIADSCPSGFDGWLYWTFDRLPTEDDTWGFTDADGYLFDALSPASQPDPCTPTLRNPNLAAGKAVTASGATAEDPPENAVDGFASGWVSGGDPVQWIEIDLGKEENVGSMRLTVAQHPAGSTTHRIDVAGHSGDRRTVHTFAGDTSEGDVLEVVFEEPLSGVRYVRVTTLQSPSWVAWSEIEVLMP